jgi:TIR domain-containing protein
LSQADYLIVVISTHSLKSRWVREELGTVLFDQVTEGKIKVLPLLLDDSELPKLLRKRKYANFRQDYWKGFDEILSTIFPLPNSKPLDPSEISVLGEVYAAGENGLTWSYKSMEDFHLFSHYKDDRDFAMHRLQSLGLIDINQTGAHYVTTTTLKLTEVGKVRAEMLFKTKRKGL